METVVGGFGTLRKGASSVGSAVINVPFQTIEVVKDPKPAYDNAVASTSSALEFGVENLGNSVFDAQENIVSAGTTATKIATGEQQIFNTDLLSTEILEEEKRQPGDELLDSSDEFTSDVVVHEIFENQRWRATGGDTTGGTFSASHLQSDDPPPFSNRIHKQPGFRSLSASECPCPTGWQWIDEEWLVDSLHSPNASQPHGWLYAVSMPALIRNLTEHVSIGESRADKIRERKAGAKAARKPGDEQQVAKGKHSPKPTGHPLPVRWRRHVRRRVRVEPVAGDLEEAADEEDLTRSFTGQNLENKGSLVEGHPADRVPEAAIVLEGWLHTYSEKEKAWKLHWGILIRGDDFGAGTFFFADSYESHPHKVSKIILGEQDNLMLATNSKPYIPVSLGRIMSDKDTASCFGLGSPKARQGLLLRAISPNDATRWQMGFAALEAEQYRPGTLSLTIVSAEGLAWREGKESTYVSLRLMVGDRTERETTFKMPSTEPVWNVLFRFPAVFDDVAEVCCVVSHSSGILGLSDHALGQVNFRLKDVFADYTASDVTLPLKPVTESPQPVKFEPEGSLTLKIQWIKGRAIDAVNELESVAAKMDKELGAFIEHLSTTDDFELKDYVDPEGGAVPDNDGAPPAKKKSMFKRASFAAGAQAKEARREKAAGVKEVAAEQKMLMRMQKALTKKAVLGSDIEDDELDEADLKLLNDVSELKAKIQAKREKYGIDPPTDFDKGVASALLAEEEVTLINPITGQPLTKNPLAATPPVEAPDGEYQLRVHVIEARGLIGRDANGSCDPCVTVQCFGQKKSSQTKPQETSPVWDENIFIIGKDMDHIKLQRQQIEIEVRDMDLFGSDLVGAVNIDLSFLYEQPDHQLRRRWLVLTAPYEARAGGMSCNN